MPHLAFIPHLCSAKRYAGLSTLLVTLVISGCASVTTPLDDSTVNTGSEAECIQQEPGNTTPQEEPTTTTPQEEPANTTLQDTEVKEPAVIWPCPVCPEVEIKKCPASSTARVANKTVLGEYELVTVAPPGFKFLSRIDTGATSTAIHATKITRFERDGQDWVRFDLSNPKDQKTVTLERQLIRRIRIKQIDDDDDVDRRLTVMMNLQLGKIERQIEVSLTDRSNMEFPLLIGRNFLMDKAVVDVSLRRTAN